ncbi:hypothetical protein [Methyloversatilis sp.]|uniref:ATP-dependent DNA ligase n=1 Tax=Methyloversatilis sp. TaxID=2569862 RepID=UPI0035B35EBB
MNSREIFALLEEIASTSSRIEKEDLIGAKITDENFLFVLKAALNPFVTYGIAKIELNGSKSGHDIAWKDLAFILLDLSSRKLSGNAARETLIEFASNLNFESAALLQAIILKDLRSGFSESTINKIAPGTIPTFDCMLAHPFKKYKHKVQYPVAVEPKLDGVRVLTFVNLNSKVVKFFSRSGREFMTFEHLIEPVINFAEVLSHDPLLADGQIILDSEVVSGIFNETVSQVRKKDVQAVDAKLYVFDVLPGSTFEGVIGKKGCEIAGSYIKRRDRLELAHAITNDEVVQVLPVHFVESEGLIHSLYETFRANGLEGVIVKNTSGLYERKRSTNWLKIKAEESVDVRVIGWERGTGKFEGLIGALVVDFNGVEVRVGSGLTDDMRKEDPSLFIGRLVEIEYHEVTPDGSLRHPRFKRFRDDKDVSEA